MNILIVFDRKKNIDNLFVNSLLKAMEDKDVNIYCSVIEFWNPSRSYDVIHFQWPEEIIGWNMQNKETLNKLYIQIKEYKIHNVKIVYTMHNSIPHYGNNILNEAYELIEKSADSIIHLGKYSARLNIIKETNTRQHNYVILHHIYQNEYNLSISKEEACKKLNILSSKYIYLAFGKFRNKSEVFMTIIPFLLLPYSNKLLLAPRLIPSNINSKIKLILKRILKKINIIAGDNSIIISNDDLPYYFSACDCVFIQRNNIINSGNVPMGFLFKKKIIGPNIGNISEYLRINNNLIYNPYNYLSILKSLIEAQNKKNDTIGMKNYIYACKNMNVKLIASQYLDVYKKYKNK